MGIPPTNTLSQTSKSRKKKNPSIPIEFWQQIFEDNYDSFRPPIRYSASNEDLIFGAGLLRFVNAWQRLPNFNPSDPAVLEAFKDFTQTMLTHKNDKLKAGIKRIALYFCSQKQFYDVFKSIMSAPAMALNNYKILDTPGIDTECTPTKKTFLETLLKDSCMFDTFNSFDYIISLDKENDYTRIISIFSPKNLTKENARLYDGRVFKELAKLNVMPESVMEDFFNFLKKSKAPRFEVAEQYILQKQIGAVLNEHFNATNTATKPTYKI